MNRLRKAALACGLVALSSDAEAYVRSRSNECNPLYWAQQCVFVTLDKNGATNGGVTDMPFADVETATKNAIASWADRLPPAGSFMQLRYSPSNQNWETVLDYIPVIKFRYDTCRDQCGPSQWCRPGVNGAKASCYDRSAAALTGMLWGLLDETVTVHARGGDLTVTWRGRGHPVLMSGATATVFKGELSL